MFSKTLVPFQYLDKGELNCHDYEVVKIVATFFKTCLEDMQLDLNDQSSLQGQIILKNEESKSVSQNFSSTTEPLA